MNRRTKELNITKQRGFTLIEVMLTTVMLGGVIVLVFGFAQFVSQNFSFSFDQSRAIEDAERTAAYITRGLRQVRQADNGAYGLAQTDDQAITFYADNDGDGQSERVRYFLQGSLMKQGVIQPVGTPATYPTANERVTVVVSDIVNGASPVFSYYNQNWPGDTINNPLVPASRALQTRLVKINLAVKAGNSAQSPTVQVSNGVMLRALKTNN